MTQRRIGILGGSFNPPHLGHLDMAETAKNQLNLSEVWLMVSPQNPLKSDAHMAPIADRMAMCEKMTKDKPWLIATDIEQKLGTQFTADTLKKLTSEYPNTTFFWLMGDDNLEHFHKWQNWQEIAQMVPLVVFRRNGHNKALESPAACALKDFQVQANSPNETPPNWRLLDNAIMDISATYVRENMEAHKNILAPDVHAYIQKKHLYIKEKSAKTKGVSHKCI